MKTPSDLKNLFFYFHQFVKLKPVAVAAARPVGRFLGQLALGAVGGGILEYFRGGYHVDPNYQLPPGGVAQTISRTEPPRGDPPPSYVESSRTRRIDGRYQYHTSEPPESSSSRSSGPPPAPPESYESKNSFAPSKDPPPPKRRKKDYPPVVIPPYTPYPPRYIRARFNNPYSMYGRRRRYPSTTYRRRSAYTYRRRLYYPRGLTRRASLRSRGPYRVNRTVPELKEYDLFRAPFPVSYGAMTNNTDTPYFAWGSDPDQWNSWTGTNDSAVVFGPLNIPAAGTSTTQRIGSRIFCKSLYFQWTWRTWADATTEVSQPVSIRTLFILDTQPNAQFLDLNSVFVEVPYNGSVNAILPNSPMNLDNRDRYRVLMDTRDTLNPAGDQIRNYSKFLPLNFWTQFVGATLGVTSNALYVVFISDGYRDAPPPATLIDTRPYVKFTSRIRFTDP